MFRTILFWLSLFIISDLTAQNHSGKLDKYVTAYASVYDINGALIVTRNNQVLYKKAFGLANREWNIPNSTETRFRIASLTKQFTAAAILQLEEQGLLSTEDKLSKYFPDFPKADSITLHMLLNHTSGIREQAENPDLFDINPNKPIEEIRDTLLNTFKHLPFYFAPGTFWRYSNSNYILLGLIIEKVSGESYRQYLSNHIFRNAGMNNSNLLSHDSIVPMMADGYIKHGSNYKKAMTIPVNTSFSAGGIFSTLEDLVKWNKSLYSGKIITRQSLEKMTKPNHPDRGAGYGLFIDWFFDRQAIMHTGNHPGYSSFMIYYPKDSVTIIILTNKETNLDFLPKGIAGIMFDQQVVIPYKHKAISTSINFSGKYMADYPIELIWEENKLFWNVNRKIELTPESATKFFIDEQDVDIQFEFIMGSKNEVTGLYLIEGGVKTKFRKEN
jgi:CubicO group peptidase (beta-lactamase class C family)